MLQRKRIGIGESAETFIERFQIAFSH
jgi:hypothetical protein